MTTKIPICSDCGEPCDTPTHVQICVPSDPPIQVADCDGNLTDVTQIVGVAGKVQVEICNPTPSTDIEYYCDADTETWWRITHLTTYTPEGVATTVTVSDTDTGKSCDGPHPVDPELYEIETCVNGFVFVQVWQVLFEDGIAQPPTTLGAPIATGLPCGPKDVEVIDDCDGNTVTQTVDTLVALAGSTRTIPVRIVEDCEDDVSVDVEYVCNEDTNVYDRVVTTVTNGVAAAPVVTATTIVCDDDEPDFEFVNECRNDTVHRVLYEIADDGTTTEISAVDTTQTCNLSIVSELVCMTMTDGTCGVNGKRVTNYLNGTAQPSTFETADGDVTADVASFRYGQCQHTTQLTCFAPEPTSIIWAWNGSGDLMSYDPITGTWTDYGKTVLPDGTTVGGFALTVKNTTNGATIYYHVGSTLYQSDPADPVGTFQEVGPSPGTGSNPCLAFNPDGQLLLGDGQTVYVIDPDTGAVLSTQRILDQRKKDANAATPGTFPNDFLQAGPGDWHFDPAGDWYMMARDIAGASFGVDTGTVLWKIDPVTYCATRVSKTDNPFGNGTGSAWLAPNQHLLSSGTGITVYNVLADVAAGTDSAWDNTVIPNAPHIINDLAAQWLEVDPIAIIGKSTCGCDGDDCDSWSWCIVEQDETTGELVERPFNLTIPGTFGSCDKIKSPFVDDPLDPTSSGGSGSGCEDCQHVWHDGCSDAGPTKWREYSASGNSITLYSYGTIAETATPPSGFTKIPCDQVVIPEVTTTPICDLDDGVTKYRREETNADGSVTVTFFDETGTIAEPASYVVGECPPDPESDTVITDEIWCVNGLTRIKRITTVFGFDADGNPTTTDSEAWFDENGPSTAPVAGDTAFLGDCVPEEPPLRSNHLIEGCIDDGNGGTVNAFTIVDETGTPLFAPKPLTDLGFLGECC